MYLSQKKNHVIDLIFPITLFFLLSACALLLILTAANVYQNTNKTADINYETTVALSYITEKIHQSDENASVSLGVFDGQDSLIIRQIYDERIYNTYIYEYDHALWELFIQDGVDATVTDGSKIISVTDFHMTQENESLFTFSCTAKDGSARTSSVAVLSTPILK